MPHTAMTSKAAHEFVIYYNALVAIEPKLSKLPVDTLRAIWYDGYITGATHIKDGSLII